MGWFTAGRTLPLSPEDHRRVQEHFPYPLTFEDKTRYGFPTSRWENGRQRSEVERKPPREWFSPFRRACRVPAWLNADHPFFTGTLKLRVTSLFGLRSGGEGWQVEIPAPRFDLNACIWAYEALCAQCVFEKWRRGFRVAHQIEGFEMPEITEDGWPIIETEEREDGSVWGQLADFNDIPAEAGDIRNFIRTVGTRHIATPYKGRFELECINPFGVPYRQERFLLGYPIGRPHVRPVLLRAADSNLNPYAPRSTVHGSAQWAWRRELADKELIDPAAPRALTGHTFLGRSVHSAPNGEAAMDHFTCWGGEGHRLIVGPPGIGKFTCAIAPLLLWSADKDSAFVLDVKNGEAATITGLHRAGLGPITVLDPFGITEYPSGSINPIDLLREDNKQLVATAVRIAEAIFLPSNAQDQHWDQAAKKTLAALLMHIGTSPVYADEERNLKTLRNIVREHIPDEVLCAMKANEAGDGEIAAEARAMLAAKDSGSDKYSFSVIATLNVNVGFLKVPEILAATERTTFNPRELREKVSTIYVVTPDHQLAAVSRWVRLIYTYVMEQLRETKGKIQVHVVLDEFPALGKFERVAQDMAQTRSLGVHMHVVVQTFQQLQETYDRGWERFQGTSAVTHVLGVRDNFTAEQVSKMLGTTTVKTSGQSQTRGNSGGSQSESSNYAARALMTPDELLAMPAERCLVVVGGMNPVRLEKVPYHRQA
jgi:type IV secretion system protein VirD4